MISGGHTHNIAGIIDWGALNVSDRKAICFYAPNFEEVEGAYWFGSVRPVLSSPVQSSLSVMRE